MAGTINFKCPSCGAYLEFDPGRQRFVCAYCGADFDEQSIREQSDRREKETRKEQAADHSSLRSYHCQNCGAEIVTDETTAATRCYFCHNPVVISDRISDEFRPDAVIPFAIEKEQAKSQFDDFLHKHRFTDRRFFEQSELENFSGVYYPYWIGEFSGKGSYTGQGQTVHTVTTGHYLVTTTNYYRLEREGRLTFRNMIRKALTKADRQLSDGIHPYDPEGMKPFASGYLSGFLAEKRDIEAGEAQADMSEEIRGYIDGLMTQNTDLQSLNGQASFAPDDVQMRYVMLPAWVQTWHNKRSGKVYYYMINGQTGKTCGKLPLRAPILAFACGLTAAAVFGLMCLGGAFLW